MQQLIAALDAAWKILLLGLLVGAGMPTLVAFGIRSLAWAHADTKGTGVLRPRVIGRAVAYLLFTFVLLVVALGIGYIIAHGMGVKITFNGLIPVFS